MTKIQLLQKKIILSIIKENALGGIITRLCTTGLNISEPEDVEIETTWNGEIKTSVLSCDLQGSIKWPNTCNWTPREE